MTLIKVKEEILAQAQEEAEQIIAHAQRDAEAILAQAREEVQAYRERAKEHNVQLVAALEKQLLSGARSESMRSLEQTKRALLDQVMQAAHEELVGLTKVKREKFLRMLLAKAKDEISVATVYVAPQDKALVKAGSSLKVKTDDSLTGGLMAETKDGSISVDYSLHELLRAVGEKELIKLSGVLF